MPPSRTTEPSAAEPFISVVVATRNRGASVSHTVRSLLASDYRAFEVLVIDQSTDDRTKHALSPFRNDGRMHYICQDVSGVSRARNLGINRARGPWIAILDDDCVVPPDWLHQLAPLIGVDPNLGVVFGNVLPGPHDAARGFVPAYVRNAPFLARSMRHKVNVEGLSACMAVRRSAWEALNGFDEGLGAGGPMLSGAETDFTIRALLAGYAVYESPTWSLTHHGFRTWTEGMELVGRYWYGTGSVFAKLMRRGHGSVALLLLRLGIRWLGGKTSRVAASLGPSDRRWQRLVAFGRGFVRGALAPLDRRTGHFRLDDHDLHGRPAAGGESRDTPAAIRAGERE